MDIETLVVNAVYLHFLSMGGGLICGVILVTIFSPVGKMKKREL